MNEEQLKKIQTEVEDLIADLGLSSTVKVDFDAQLDLINIQLESPQAASLIGFHGETLQAFQLILTFLSHRIAQRWVRVSVNIGDYRQKREEQLKRLALNLATKVKFSGEAQVIPNLTAAERRIIHLALTGHPEVTTESEGEGRERILTIKPKISA